MTAASVTIRIWARAVLLNAVIISLFFVPRCNVFAIPVMFMALLGGFLLTWPLIPVIDWLLAIFARMPYHITDKFTWLLFALILLAAAYYMVFYMAMPFLRGARQWELVICGTSIAVTTAVFWTKSSIIPLNKYEQSNH
jgi:hypothetical protein